MTEDFKSRLFTVPVFFRSLRNGQSLPANIWEESLYLIRAQAAADAVVKAEAIAQSRRLEYSTSDGERLIWEFFKAGPAYEVFEGLNDGSEIFSRHLRNSEAESLLTPFED
jgi:hypothetical protein